VEVQEVEVVDQQNTETVEFDNLTFTTKEMYQCGQCFKILSTIHSIEQHMQTHDPLHQNTDIVEVDDSTLSAALKTKEMYQCGQCSKLLSTIHSLRRHMQTHDPLLSAMLKPVRKYPCNVCRKMFATPVAVERHMTVHTGKKRFACKICLKRFTQKVHCQHHMLGVHTVGAKSFKCVFPGCQRRFIAQYQLKRHLKRHSKVGTWPCKECGKAFTTPYLLKRHMLVHSDPSKQFKCDICEAVFSSKMFLHRHKKIHTQQNINTCQACFQSFKSWSGFKAHVKSKCGRAAYKYPCDKCEKCFFKAESLNRHNGLFHEIGGPVYKCDSCTRAFTRRNGLCRHKKKLHRLPTDAQPATKPQYLCKVCRKEFSSLKEFKKHENSHAGTADTSELVFVCRNCGEEFLLKSDLIYHITETHTLAYVCHVCGDRFRNAKAVRVHMVAMHSVE
jgi:KRAB domain-containing zinc finger protein